MSKKYILNEIKSETKKIKIHEYVFVSARTGQIILQ